MAAIERRRGTGTQHPAMDAFVGRGEELGTLRRLLEQDAARLVTVWGAGGIGKTRLLLEFVRACRRDTVFCDLGAARTLDELCGAVARALGLPPIDEERTHPAVRLGHALAARGPVLLVLDNMEQLVASAADSAGRWLTMAPTLQVVVTSRALLRLPGEQTLELAPLEPREGMQLFVERARQAGCTSLLEDGLVEELARRLDGIPLAIELAAARTRLLSVPELVERLARRFELLAHGALTNPRHETLRRAIDWSWQLLGVDEQDALSQCAVFRGGFTIAAAEAVVVLGPGDGPILDVLQSLREKALLRELPAVDGRTRRFDLLESVRAFVMEERPGLLASASDRHAAHFARTDPEHALVERDNLVAVIEHAPRSVWALQAVLALVGTFDAWGPLATCADLLDRVLTHQPADADGRLVAKALVSRGGLRTQLGRVREAEEDLREAAVRAGDAGTEAEALMLLATACDVMGRSSETPPAFDRALALFREIGDVRREGACLGRRGIVRHMAGDLEGARVDYEAALRLHRAAGDGRAEGRTLARLGFLQQDLGELAKARAIYAQALSVARAEGHRGLEGIILGYHGNVDRQERRAADARAHYDAAVTMLRAVGDHHYEAVFLMDRGILELDQQRPADARVFLDEARQRSAEMSERRIEALSRGYLAVAYAATGDFAEASSQLDEAERIGAASSSELIAQVCRLHRGHLSLADAAPLAQTAVPDRFEHVRLARRLLVRALTRSSPPLDACAVSEDGSRFRPPHGDWIELARRQALPGLLRALVEQWNASPGVPLASHELVARGWPGEKIQPAAATNRLRVAMSTLRTLGLRELLVARDGGYLLDAQCTVVSVPVTG